jgi:hypothetical protein
MTLPPTRRPSRPRTATSSSRPPVRASGTALIFSTKTPQSFPTFLVDGAVAGSWRYEHDRVELGPFEPLPAGTVRELEDEAAERAVFHGAGA